MIGKPVKTMAGDVLRFEAGEEGGLLLLTRDKQDDYTIVTLGADEARALTAMLADMGYAARSGERSDER